MFSVSFLFQSSCTKPDFETESAPVDMQEFSPQMLGKTFLGDLRMQKDEAHINSGEISVMNESSARGITSLPIRLVDYHLFSLVGRPVNIVRRVYQIRANCGCL